MILDEYDLKELSELYEYDLINNLNIENVNKIYNYLISKGVYYAKDMFIENLELFLLDSNEFIKRFEKLIKKLGKNYVDKLGENSEYLNYLYEKS